MSYILDALKRSQQERPESQVLPGSVLASSMAATPEYPPAAMPWVIPAVAAAAVTILSLALWLTFGPYFSRDGEQATAVVALPEITPTDANDRPEVVALPVAASLPDPAPVIEALDPSLVVKSRPAPVLAVTSAVRVDKVIPLSISEKSIKPQKIVESASQQVSKITPEAIETGSSPSAPTIEQRVLPPLSALRKLPDIIISSHIYSADPVHRSIQMNGRGWSEGDRISSSVILQEITPEGILVDVDGYPFHINRNNGWQALAD